jgi:hypothetical protein
MPPPSHTLTPGLTLPTHQHLLCTMVLPVLSSTVLYVQYRCRISPTILTPTPKNQTVARSLAPSFCSSLLLSSSPPTSILPRPSPRPLSSYPFSPIGPSHLTLAPIPGNGLQTSYLALLNRSLRCIADQGKTQIPSSHSSHSQLNDSGLSETRIYTCLLRPLHSPPSSPHTPGKQPDSSGLLLSIYGPFPHLLCFNGDTLHISSFHSHIQPNARLHHLTDRLSFLTSSLVPSSRERSYM